METKLTVRFKQKADRVFAVGLMSMQTQKLIIEINQLTESVRNYINTHRYQVVLLENSDKWNQICSSLDVIGDSLLAIEAYQVVEYPNNGGLKYIYTYGVLQALFILQDAVLTYPRHLKSHPKYRKYC